jgi:hypothetical protein
LSNLSIKLPSKEEIQKEKWRRDKWLWIQDCCWTVDEADDGKIKRFPDKGYLKYICEVFDRETILAIPKTRRMMLSWIMLALHLHEALFKPNSAIFVQSKKEDDSDFLIGDRRLMFMYNNLPKEYDWPSADTKYCNIDFGNGSFVKGIAQGADQLRQYTASRVMVDEAAFQEKFEEAWGALKPTIQGGGKVVLISSAGPGFFQRLVEGEI